MLCLQKHTEYERQLISISPFSLVLNERIIRMNVSDLPKINISTMKKFEGIQRVLDIKQGVVMYPTPVLKPSDIVGTNYALVYGYLEFTGTVPAHPTYPVNPKSFIDRYYNKSLFLSIGNRLQLHNMRLKYCTVWKNQRWIVFQQEIYAFVCFRLFSKKKGIGCRLEANVYDDWTKEG